MQIQGEGSGLVVGSVCEWARDGPGGAVEWVGGRALECVWSGVEWSGRVGREDTRLNCTQARMRRGQTMHDVQIEHDHLNMNEVYYQYSASNTVIDSPVIDHWSWIDGWFQHDTPWMNMIEYDRVSILVKSHWSSSAIQSCQESSMIECHRVLSSHAYRVPQV